MVEPFLGEIKINSFDYAPKGWAACDGAQLAINQNQALFALLGTSFGGNGMTVFNLPDLRGRVAVQQDLTGFLMGQVGGEQAHTLTPQEAPVHNHIAQGSANAGTTPLPQGNVLANPGLNAYAVPNPAQPIAQGTVVPTGGGQPHENMSPYLALNFCIALVGIFPSRN